MVKADDIMDTHPLERMDQLDKIRSEKKQSLAAKKKELEELEQKKRQEIDELENKKKKELEDLDSRKRKELDEIEKKKKEFEELGKKKAKEIEETEDLIDKSFQDLMRHKRMLIAQEDEKYQKSLEERTSGAPSVAQKNIDYGIFFEKLEVPDKLYEITNKGFYENLTHLRDKALTGELTPQEETFIEQLRDRFEQFNQPGYLNNRDDHEYLQRSLNVIKDIDVSIYYR